MAGTPLSPVNFVNKADNLGGLARNNKFSVTITPPTKLMTAARPEQWEFLCKGADLPAVAMNTTEDRIYGIEVLKPYGVTYEPITLSFYNTNDFSPKIFWEDWLDYIQPAYSRNMNYYDDFTGDIKLYHYSDYCEDPSPGNENYFCHLRETWPLSLQESEMEMEGDEIAFFDVQIQYKYWNRGSGTASSVDRGAGAAAADDTSTLAGQYASYGRGKAGG